MIAIFRIVFDGAAFGMLLFTMSIGLSVTLGMMRFVNLSHGVFVMLGGYAVAVLMTHAGWPYLATLPVAFVAAAALSLALDPLYRRVFMRGEMRQVLLTIGIVYIAIAVATYGAGPFQMSVVLPRYLTGYASIGPFDFSVYGAFLIATGGLLALAVVLGLERTLFGAKIRAAVDNRPVALGCGINVDRIFNVTFAIGGGLAGLGGALGVNLLGVDPFFPLKYLVYVLIVVSIGGAGSVQGSLLAALILGWSDVAGKYYLPQLGSLIIYVVMLALLLWRPAGLGGRR